MSKRILSARLKSALNTAAITQVAAHGFRVHNSCTVFNGKGAFVVYTMWQESYYDKLFGRKTGPARKFRINYPAMPDDVMLTRGEADILTAYMLHETAHVMYTNNDIIEIAVHLNESSYKVRNSHTVANGFEDPRIEESVNREGKAKNSRILFDRLLAKVTEGARGKGYNPCDWANVPLTIALLGREALGNGNAFTATLLNRIPEPYRSIYAKAVGWFADAPMGFDETGWAYKCAIEFGDLWADMRKDEGKQPPPPPPPPPPMDEGDDDSQDEGDQPYGPEGDQQEDGPMGDPEPGDSMTDPIDDEWSDSPDADDQEDGEASEGGDKDSDTAAGSGSKDADKDAGLDGDDGEDGDNEADQTDGGGFSPSGDSGQPKSSEPSIEDLIKRIAKRSDSDEKSSLGAFSPAARNSDISEILGSFV